MHSDNMSTQDIENRVSVNENEIDNINETLQRLEDKIDHNSNKLDDLTNGSLSKAIQKQNNKLIQEVIGLVNDEKELRREIQLKNKKKVEDHFGYNRLIERTNNLVQTLYNE